MKPTAVELRTVYEILSGTYDKEKIITVLKSYGADSKPFSQAWIDEHIEDFIKLLKQTALNEYTGFIKSLKFENDIEAKLLYIFEYRLDENFGNLGEFERAEALSRLYKNDGRWISFKDSKAWDNYVVKNFI